MIFFRDLAISCLLIGMSLLLMKSNYFLLMVISNAMYGKFFVFFFEFLYNFEIDIDPIIELQNLLQIQKLVQQLFLIHSRTSFSKNQSFCFPHVVGLL